MQIEIHTFDKQLVSELFGKTEISSGDAIRLNDDARLIFRGIYIRKAVGFPEIFQFVLDHADAIAASIAANFLYELLKGKKVEKLVIGGQDVPLDLLKIKYAICSCVADVLIPYAVIISRTIDGVLHEIVFAAQSSAVIVSIDLRVNDDNKTFTRYADMKRYLFNDDLRFRYVWRITDPVNGDYIAEIIATDIAGYLMHATRTIKRRLDGRWY